MKRFFRWLGKIIGSALTIVLVIVLFPHISKLAAKLMPDESGAAIKASAILAQNFESSARLETLKVEEEGVLNYDIQAAFIGSVANINATYTYEASFGVDLSKVTMQIADNELKFLLPEPELIQDNLTPNEVYRDDFWYPGFSDSDYERLMENERLARQAAYLDGENSEQLWNATVSAFESTIATWLKDVNAALTFRYEKAPSPTEN